VPSSSLRRHVNENASEYMCVQLIGDGKEEKGIRDAQSKQEIADGGSDRGSALRHELS